MRKPEGGGGGGAGCGGGGGCCTEQPESVATAGVPEPSSTSTVQSGGGVNGSRSIRKLPAPSLVPIATPSTVIARFASARPSIRRREPLSSERVMLTAASAAAATTTRVRRRAARRLLRAARAVILRCTTRRSGNRISSDYSFVASVAAADFFRRFRPPRLPRRVRFFFGGCSPSALAASPRSGAGT